MIPGKLGTFALLWLAAAHVDSGAPGPSGVELQSLHGDPDDDGGGSGTDVEHPDTSISAAPPEVTSSPRATFRFTSNEAGVSYQCSLDGAAFTACAESVDYGGLADGGHVLRARAVDAAGNADRTSATHAWSVDTVPPDTHVVSAPQAIAASTEASFAFGASEPGVSYECGLDEDVLAACASAVVYSGLADGVHTLQVRARDVAGNVDDTPARYSWTVDTAAPDTFIVEGPSALTGATSATFSFASNRGDAYFECSLDGVAFVPCANPVTFTGLAHGDHALQVRARNGTPVVLTPVDKATLDVGRQVFTGLAEAGSTVSLYLDGENRETTVASDAGTWAVASSQALAPGSYSVTVIATDAAGNSSAASAPTRFNIATRGYYDFGCSATPRGGGGAWIALALGACLFRPRARSRGRLPAPPGSGPGVLS